MNRRGFLASLPLLPALARAQAGDAQARTGDAQARTGDAQDGFVSLFDGRSLAGWSVREGPPSAFYARDGAIVVHEGSNFPTWLRSDRRYENFDFRCEFFVKGWTNSGLFLHAPEHGRNTWVGMKINIFHKRDTKPLPESMGAVFPLIPPSSVNVRGASGGGEWNTLRVLMDWPALRVWVNEEQVQDVNVEAVPELRHRLRRGYLGLESLSYPIRFRNLRIRELASKEKWEPLYERPEDFDAKWMVAEGKAKWEPLGEVLRGDGLGHLATREQFRDFELHLYIRPSKHSNGGILFRSSGEALRARHYEIQIHDVEGAVYPTGSLYGHQRSIYPRIEPEEWYLTQLVVKGRDCLVRINGDTVVDHHNLADLEPGHILLQAHQQGRWIEYKQIRLQRL